MESLKRLHTLFPTALSRYFSIENAGSHNRADINPDALYGNDGKQLLSKKISPFYASSILQRDEEAAQAFFSTVPFSTPPHLGAGAAEHDDGTWLFFGHNPPPAGNAAEADGIDAVSKGKGSASKRRKLIGGAKPGKAATLSGRAEHTDKVSHDGTWHVQLAGTKTWLIRPDAASLEWKGCPPELKKETPGVVQRGVGGLRLQVDVAEGDFLCINTRIWYHRTDIQVQTQSKDALSISYARDFYLCSSGEKDGNNGGDDDDDDAGIDVEQGSELKMNDADSLDPRLFAKSNIACGDVALFEEQLPDELSIPRSLHPSCELVEAEVDGVCQPAKAVNLNSGSLTRAADRSFLEADCQMSRPRPVHIDNSSGETDTDNGVGAHVGDLEARSTSYNEALPVPRSKSMRRVSEFSPEVQLRLQKWDVNGDGELDEAELVSAIRSEARQSTKLNHLKTYLVVAVAMLGASIASNFGTSYYAFKEASDTTVGNDGTMMTKTDGNAHIVQVGVADLSTEPSTHIGGDGVVPSEMLTNPITQTPIRVLTETEALPVTLMTSELPDSAFDELKMLKVKGSSGSINFNVQGYARYGTLKGKSRCGSVVVVYTGQGHVQFDGVAMTFSESVAGAFERAGFAVTSRRRGRRAEDPDGHGLLGVREVMGKFNTLANMDLNTTLLSCGDDKPSMKPFFPLGDAPPSEIAFTEHLLIPCTFGWVEEDGSGAADLAECPDDDNDLNGEPDYVLDFGGRKFFKRIRTTRAKFFNGTFYSISEVTFPELAGYSLIELNNETHVTRYTKNDGDGGRAQHCRAGPIGEVGHGSGGHAITAESAKYVILDTADPAICIPPQPTIDFKGYEVLDGVYVRHFEVVRPDFFDCTTGVLRTKGYTTDYYEHFAENRMFAITMQNVYDRIETYESVTTAPDATLLQGPGMPSLDLDPAGAAEAFMSRPAECSSTDAARDLHAGFLIPEHFDLEFWEEDVAEDLADRARHTIDPEQAAELSKLLEDEEDPEQAIEAVVAAAGGSRTDKFEKCLKAAEVAYSEATLSEAANATFDAAERKCAGAGDTPSQAIIDCVDRLNLTSSDNASAAETDSIDSCFGDVLNKTGSGIHDVDGSGDGGDGGGRERKNHIWDFPVVRDDGWTPRSPYKKGEHCSMCKTDADCDRPNHLCIKLESEYDVIPGCTEYSKTRPLWDGVSGWGLFGAHAAGLSYCADPTDTVKLDSAATCTDNNKCSTCQGGCTADSQCGGDLVCRQRPFMSSDVFWEMERNVQKSCAENCNCCRGSICPGGGGQRIQMT
eukprot:gene3780-9669_t